jgi:hypothetical protein
MAVPSERWRAASAAATAAAAVRRTSAIVSAACSCSWSRRAGQGGEIGLEGLGALPGAVGGVLGVDAGDGRVPGGGLRRSPGLTGADGALLGFGDLAGRFGSGGSEGLGDSLGIGERPDGLLDPSDQVPDRRLMRPAHLAETVQENRQGGLSQHRRHGGRALSDRVAPAGLLALPPGPGPLGVVGVLARPPAGDRARPYGKVLLVVRHPTVLPRIVRDDRTNETDMTRGRMATRAAGESDDNRPLGGGRQ